MSPTTPRGQNRLALPPWKQAWQGGHRTWRQPGGMAWRWNWGSRAADVTATVIAGAASPCAALGRQALTAGRQPHLAVASTATAQAVGAAGDVIVGDARVEASGGIVLPDKALGAGLWGATARGDGSAARSQSGRRRHQLRISFALGGGDQLSAANCVLTLGVWCRRRAAPSMRPLRQGGRSSAAMGGSAFTGVAPGRPVRQEMHGYSSRGRHEGGAGEEQQEAHGGLRDWDASRMQGRGSFTRATAKAGPQPLDHRFCDAILPRRRRETLA